MRQAMWAALSALVFAFGLGLGGMTNPEKVLAFLDFTGAWDPSLAFVMGGALTTHALMRKFILQRKVPLCAKEFPTYGKQQVDGRLLAGAALFGVGWGLGGLCPGPALTAIGSGTQSALLFGASLWGGMILFALWDRARKAAAARATAPVETQRT